MFIIFSLCHGQVYIFASLECICILQLLITIVKFDSKCQNHKKEKPKNYNLLNVRQ